MALKEAWKKALSSLGALFHLPSSKEWWESVGLFNHVFLAESRKSSSSSKLIIGAQQLSTLADSAVQPHALTLSTITLEGRNTPGVPLTFIPMPLLPRTPFAVTNRSCQFLSVIKSPSPCPPIISDLVFVLLKQPSLLSRQSQTQISTPRSLHSSQYNASFPPPPQHYFIAVAFSSSSDQLISV